MAEVPIIATRRELRGNGLARLLLRALEATLVEAGCKMVIMPSTVVFPPPRRTAGLAAQLATLPLPWPLKVSTPPFFTPGLATGHHFFTLPFERSPASISLPWPLRVTTSTCLTPLTLLACPTANPRFCLVLERTRG